MNLNNLPVWMIYALLVFATWRISSLFANENGPFDIFAWIRHFFYMRSLKGFENKRNPFNALMITMHDGINCIWCNSVWFAGVLSLKVSYNIIDWLLNTLALSAGAILLNSIIEVLLWRYQRKEHS